MNPQTPHHDLAGDEGGFVLIFALLVLLTLTLLGFMAVDTSVNESSMSGNDQVQRQTFSLADGGTQVAIHLLQENMDCPTGFPAALLAQGTGDIQFRRSIAFNGTPNDNDYTVTLPPAVRAQAAAAVANNLPANLYDSNLIPFAPEIVRQFCIGGEGVNIPGRPGGNNGCDPLAIDGGAPHTNILYNPNPNNTGPRHADGESGNATGGSTTNRPGGIINDIQLVSQHVAYQRANGITNRESVIRMTWAQPNNSFNNCLY